MRLALEELAAAGEEDLCRSRHRRWFAGLWRDAPLSDALVEHVGRTYDDHLDALTGALFAGDDPAAADLTTTLSRRSLSPSSASLPSMRRRRSRRER